MKNYQRIIIDDKTIYLKKKITNTGDFFKFAKENNVSVQIILIRGYIHFKFYDAGTIITMPDDNMYLFVNNSTKQYIIGKENILEMFYPKEKMLTEKEP